VLPSVHHLTYKLFEMKQPMAQSTLLLFFLLFTAFSAMAQKSTNNNANTKKKLK
jgi:hypothetical protein